MTPEQERLILDNRHLVRAALNSLGGMRRYTDRDGLIGAGNLALVQAAARWDPTRGVPFRRFAFIRIRGALIDEVRTGSFGTRSVHDEAVLIHRAARELQHILGRQPTTKELADQLDWPVERVEQAETAANSAYIFSLDPILADGVQPADTHPGPDALYADAETAAEVHAAIARLRPRHREIVTAYYLHGRDQADIAAEYGVTNTRISQILADACGRLKRTLAGAMHTRAA